MAFVAQLNVSMAIFLPQSQCGWRQANEAAKRNEENSRRRRNEMKANVANDNNEANVASSMTVLTSLSFS